MKKCEWFNEREFVKYFEGRIEDFVTDIGMWVEYSTTSESINIGMYKKNRELSEYYGETHFDDTILFRLAAHHTASVRPEVGYIYAWDFGSIEDMWESIKSEIIRYFVDMVNSKKHLEEF